MNSRARDWLLPPLALGAALWLAGNPVVADDAPAAGLSAAANLQARAPGSPVGAAAPVESAAGNNAPGGDKKLLGISILGNQEAPKALVLVPWKSSQLGANEGISRSLDDQRRPVDREVFMRELAYYEIRENSP